MESPVTSANHNGGHHAVDEPLEHAATAPDDIDSSPTQHVAHSPSNSHLPQESNAEIQSSSPIAEGFNQNVQHNSQSIPVHGASHANSQQVQSDANTNTKLPEAQIADAEPLSPAAKPSWRYRLRSSFSNWWTWGASEVCCSACYVSWE